MSRAGRSKLSTTISAENYRFLTSLVKSGKAESLAEAVDEAVENFRKSENRRRLAQATSEYFDALSPKELAEERSLAAAMHEMAKPIDFDNEL
jgi:Arc/MetJ-type ribon-helix-helix transcriptional regulator